MTRWWREHLARRRAVVAAALLLIVALLGGSALVFLPRSGSGAPGPTASATPVAVAAATATPGESPTASPSPTPTASPTATAAPTARPTAARPALADLTYKSAGIGSGSVATCGKANQVWVNVTNRGSATAPAGVEVYLEVRRNGERLWWEFPTTSKALAPGQTVKVYSSFTPRSPCMNGTMTWSFLIDRDARVPESNESNNGRTYTFTLA